MDLTVTLGSTIMATGQGDARWIGRGTGEQLPLQSHLQRVLQAKTPRAKCKFDADSRLVALLEKTSPGSRCQTRNSETIRFS